MEVILVFESGVEDIGCPFFHQRFYDPSRVRKIISGLAYTDILHSLSVDKFWYMRYMIRAWKDHMKENFVPSWVNGFDDIIYIWSTNGRAWGGIFFMQASYLWKLLQHNLIWSKWHYV